ncbi:MAG: glycosyltransferase family 39 protein [Bdellovibrionota bacterium]
MQSAQATSTATAATTRSWRWPFDLRRLATTRALQAALVFFAAGVVLRTILALTSPITHQEATLWMQSSEIWWRYADQWPLPVWITRAGIEVLGNHWFVVRIPALLCSIASSLLLFRLIALLGWSRGSDVTAVLCLTTPPLLLGGVFDASNALLFLIWMGLAYQSYVMASPNARSQAAGWMKFTALSTAALLTSSFGVIPVGSALVWFAVSRNSRSLFSTGWPYISVALSLLLSSPAWVASPPETLAVSSVTDTTAHWFWSICFRILVCTPYLLLGNLLALKEPTLTSLARESRSQLNMRFLKVWALGSFCAVFIEPALALIPALIYAAKVSNGSLQKPKWLHRAVVCGVWFTTIWIFLLYFPAAFQNLQAYF